MRRISISSRSRRFFQGWRTSRKSSRLRAACVPPARARCSSSTNSSFQPGAARRIPAGDGGRHHHAGGRHDRKPVLRTQRRASVARACAISARWMRRPFRTSCSGPRRSPAKRCPWTRRRAPRWCAWPMAMAARCSPWPRRSGVREARRDLRRRAAAGDHPAPRSDLRQGPGGALQPDLGPAQDDPRFRSGRGFVLPGAHARCGRGQAFHRRATGSSSGRRYRARGSAGAVIANAAKDAFDFLGSPEGELALAQATVYLATAPKSNAVYTAYKAATRTAKEHGSLMPPKTILNEQDTKTVEACKEGSPRSGRNGDPSHAPSVGRPSSCRFPAAPRKSASQEISNRSGV